MLSRARCLVLLTLLAALPAPARAADLFPPLEPAWRVSATGGFYMPPAIVNGTAYAVGLDGTVMALDAATGEGKWRFAIGAQTYGGVAVGRGLAVVGATNRNVYARDAATGEAKWERELDGILYARPVIGDGLVYLGTGETGTLYALDAATGEPRWTFTLGGRLGSGLVLAGDTLYAGSYDRKLYALNPANGQVRWQVELPGIIDSLPLVAGGTVFVKLPDDSLYALDARDGSERWRREPREPAAAADTTSNWSPLTLAEGLLLFGSADGRLHAVDARNGEERWSVGTDSRIVTAPLVEPPFAFVGTRDGSLLAVDVAGGTTYWRWTPDEPDVPAEATNLSGIQWPPVLYQDHVLVASLAGELISFRPTGTRAAWQQWQQRRAALREALGGVDEPLTQVAEDGGERWKLRFTLATAQGWPRQGAAAVVTGAPTGEGLALVLSGDRLRLVRRTADGGATVVAEGPVADALGPAGAERRTVTLERTGRRLRVLSGATVALEAYADLPPDGAVSIGTGGGVRMEEAVFQPTEPVWFTDDFMREQDEHGAWQPRAGQWVLSGVSDETGRGDKRPDATKSSNPFAYRATEAKEGSLATAGEWFWDTYRIEASVRADGRGALGLCAYVQDDSRYLAFEWARAGTGHERRLVEVRGGERRVLATGEGGWANDQWYRISLTAADGRLTAAIDGQPVLSAKSDAYGQGPAGVWAGQVGFADFDDVQVVAVDEVIDPFDTAPSGRWQVAAGNWYNEHENRGFENPGLKVVQGDAPSLAVTGGDDWGNLRVRAVGKAAEGGALGLVAGYQDEANYLALRWADSRGPNGWIRGVALVRVSPDGETVLRQLDLPLDRGDWHTLSLEDAGGLFTAIIDGRHRLQALVPELAWGRVGLLGHGRRTVYDEARVAFLPPAKPVEFTEQFTREETMAGWASAAGSWHITGADQRDNVYWHRGDFYGDAELAVSSELFDGGERKLRLILSGDGQHAASGYSLLVRNTTDGPKALAAQLLRGDQVVAEGRLDLDGAERLRFQRRGNFLLAGVDDGFAFGYHDDQGGQVNGHAVGVGYEGVALGAEGLLDRLWASADHNFDTTFVAAPVEWHAGSGVWETTNRWACDPRWSFFGGYNSVRPLIWTKDDFGGDQQVEAYLGIRMNTGSGAQYPNPSDLCVTVCGDGRNPLSGYSFLFATQRNTRSQLYRDGELIAENEAAEARFKYTSSDGEGLNAFHRHWFHVVVRRAQGRITCAVDDAVIFDVPDDRPLEGGKVALFSVDNGILVSRVKVWYERAVERQPFPDVDALQASADVGDSGGDPYHLDFERGIGPAQPEQQGAPLRLSRTDQAAVGRGALEVTNLTSGGDLGVLVIDDDYNVNDRPMLRFRYALEPSVRLNVYVRANEVWHVIRLVRPEGADDDGARALGAIDNAAADGRWHEAQFDLAAALEAVHGTRDVTVHRIVFAMREPNPYALAGLSATGRINPFGARYWLDEVSVGP